MKRLEGDWTDDSVWSNLAYLLSAAPAWGHLALAPMLVAGAVLAVASACYHATYERWARLLDRSAMMVYLVNTTGVVWAAALGAPWIVVAVQCSALYYIVFVEGVDSYVHAPIWMAVALIGVAVAVGWWALVPLLILIPGGLVKLIQPGADSFWHSVWHLSGAGSVASALHLVL